MGLQIALFFLMFIVGAVSFKVTCNYTTPVCTCPLNDDDDTCEFELIIQELETFKRYKLTEDGTSVNVDGTEQEWHLDEITGDFIPPGEGTCGQETDQQCTQPFTVDGKSMRSFIAINGHAPGPTLIVNENQYIVVNVINKLESNTSIHWHGMHQKNSHWMDGVEHVTQCGIPPNGRFTYIFQALQTGTHWYHSHSGDQRTIGLFGALIVKEEENKIADVESNTGDFEDKPEQHTLTFLDWQDENTVKETTMSVDGADVSTKKYWSGIINGKGRHEDVSYIATRLSIFTVSNDNTYRFRLIGAQNIFAYRVSVDEHKLIVIATDGAFLEPMEVDYIIIHSGERYDFLLKTKPLLEITNRQNFMIRAETLEVQPHFAEAILHYDTSLNSEPKSTEYQSINDNSIPVSTRCIDASPCTVLNCPFKDYPSNNLICKHIHQLKLMFPFNENDDELPDVQVGDEDKIFFNFGFEGPEGSGSMNARTMKIEEVISYPLSLTTRDKKRNGTVEDDKCKELNNCYKCDDDNDMECKCAHIRETKTNHSIQMILSIVSPDYMLNNIHFAHPVHLHGHYIHVVDIQFGEYNENGVLESTNKNIKCGGTNNCNTPNWVSDTVDFANEKTGKINPMAPVKDTLLIPSGGYAVVYFKANNPGYWFIHCHIEPHVEGGMGAVIEEGIDNAQCPPDDMKKCPSSFTYTVQKFKKDREKMKENCNDCRNVVKVEIILIMFLCVCVLWSTN